mmetsp:Transcript_20751/g.34940  ORF Transcript_20751/g.34940 Transcript_20751/m.34940 type:complete len:418 (-) Transcript_20751:72-1325(-)
MLRHCGEALLFIVLCLWRTCAAETVVENNEVDTSSRYLSFHKVGDGGCPYTASFLLDTKLYVKIKWGLKWQKMEGANWNAMSACRKRFQFRNAKDYFVNHMSAYEHAIRKKQGYNESETKTLTFSNAAKAGTCADIGDEFDQNTLAVLPFYGGRPPGVTADASGTLKVTSIGQGNSLIKAEIKALQTMAVLCSLLKYFAYVIVGVARIEDQDLIQSEVALLGDAIAVRVHVHLMHDLFKPANLPFHLLDYAKNYIKRVNKCIDELPPDTLDDVPNTCNEHFLPFVNEQKNSLGPTPVGWKVKFIYYTESDQIVKFRDMRIRDAILSATNITTMFIGRRLEKDWKSEAEDYMKGLIATRNVCGEGLYTLDWPTSHYVYKVNASEFEAKSNSKLINPVPGIDEPESSDSQNKFRIRSFG